MTKITAQNNNITLTIEFDNDSQGWFLHHGGDEFWHMNCDDAKEQALAHYGVAYADWSYGDDDANAPTLDSNGGQLKDGDNVTLIKDLPVKGAGITIKRGTMVKNISLTSNPEEIDCKTKEVKGLVLKTCFVKKV